MPYYHVSIARRSRGERSVYELDLSKENLVRFIVEPFLNGEEFICQGSPIDPADVSNIRISETEQPSSELIPRIKMRPDFTYMVSVEYYIVFHEKDVTREFITRPPKRRGIFEKREKPKQPPSQNIFIVHGRDDKPKLELARMLENLRFKAIILSEQADKGRTIIEKLEQETIDVGYVFVILTPDDFGGSMKELAKASEEYQESGDVKDIEKVFKQRARQNVILELGYFAGKIGRKRVCCLYQGDIELPSDIHGVLFKKFNESTCLP